MFHGDERVLHLRYCLLSRGSRLPGDTQLRYSNEYAIPRLMNPTGTAFSILNETTVPLHARSGARINAGACSGYSFGEEERAPVFLLCCGRCCRTRVLLNSGIAEFRCRRTQVLLKPVRGSPAGSPFASSFRPAAGHAHPLPHDEGERLRNPFTNRAAVTPTTANAAISCQCITTLPSLCPRDKR